jgi:hypothetical protein
LVETLMGTKTSGDFCAVGVGVPGVVGVGTWAKVISLPFSGAETVGLLGVVTFSGVALGVVVVFSGVVGLVDGVTLVSGVAVGVLVNGLPVGLDVGVTLLSGLVVDGVVAVEVGVGLTLGVLLLSVVATTGFPFEATLPSGEFTGAFVAETFLVLSVGTVGVVAEGVDFLVSVEVVGV